LNITICIAWSLLSSADCMQRSLSQTQMQRCALYTLIHSCCIACVNQKAVLL